MAKTLTQKEKPAKSSPGPEAERLKVNDQNWEKAVSKALHKKRPAAGWPTEKSAKQ